MPYRKRRGFSSSHGRKQFSIFEFLLIVLSKLPGILLAAVLGLLMAYAGVKHMVTPVYTATAKLYVLGQDQLSGDFSDLIEMRAGTMLAVDYQEVFKTWELEDAVCSAVGVDASKEEMYENLSVYNPEGTRILYISYTCEDPQLAADIANAFAHAAREFMTARMESQEAKIFSAALPPTENTGMGTTGYSVMGFLLGGALAVCLVFLLFAMDDRPKRPGDILEAADIPTLALIPTIAASSQKKGKGGKWL